MIRNITIFILLLFCAVADGQGYFELTDGVRSAYDLVNKLRIEEARTKIEQVKSQEPGNLLIYHIENYIDFYTLFLGEKTADYERLKTNKDKRLKKIERGDKNSPYYLFCTAEIHLQWATARLKFGEQFKPMREVYKAYKLLEKNERLFPDFLPNKKSLSIIHALSESVPGILRTVFKVRGSIEKGTQEISELVKYSKTHPSFLWTTECYAIYAYILFYQNNKPKKAYEVLKSSGLDASKSPLICFLMANMAQKTGYNDEAIQILENRPQGSEYLPFYYLEFMYGKFLMYKLDARALDHMQRFVDRFEGRHFIKEAYQKMAWFALATKDDVVSYKKYMNLCVRHGYNMVDEDKQAQKEAQNKMIPNTVLLRARLLFDGGYFQKAYKTLVLKSHLFVEPGHERLEFNYRMGRVCQALSNPHDAVEYYLKTMVEGEKDASYFACNAALQVGLILEKQHKYKEAKQLFERCFAMEPSEYKSGLHQKAKSGLDRLKKRI